MCADQILTEIREANLSYLILAQSLTRTDGEQALFCLGVSEESAALIGLPTPAQRMKIASGNTLQHPLEQPRPVDTDGLRLCGVDLAFGGGRGQLGLPHVFHQNAPALGTTSSAGC